MKRKMLLVLAAVLMLCGLSVSVCADEAVWTPENGGTVILPIIPGDIIKPSVKGDLNVDGVVNRKDVDLFAKYFAGWKIPAEDIRLSAGDVNGDGEVTRADAIELARKVAGWTYTVTFDANGSDVENLPTAQTVKTGECAEEPEEPTRLIHEFSGWYTDLECTKPFSFATKITGNITLYAKWESNIYIKGTEEAHIRQGIYKYEETTQVVEYADNQLFLVVKENTNKEDVEELIRDYSGRIIGQIPGPGYYQIEFPKSYDIDKLQMMITAFMTNEKIKNAFINLVSHEYFEASVDEFSYANAWFPDDSFGIEKTYANEKYYTIWQSLGSKNRTWGLRAANVPQAWYLASKYGTPVLDTKVAVVDNTFDASHGDLDIIVGVEDEGALEKVNHGTHVAGIIGAKTNNGIGTAGIARLSKLIGFPAGKKVETSEWIAYLAAAIECECNVINVSIGSDEYNPVMKSLSSYWAGKLADILDYYIDGAYDFLITTAAGNIGDKAHDVNYNNAITKLAETRYRDHILVVGNAEIIGFDSYQRAPKSNYIGNRVDIMAPGTDIYSTYNYGQYGYLSGTSMASPFVAGVAALIKENVNSLSMTTIREIILSTANIDVNDSTANMINAEEAMREALRRQKNTYYLKENDLREVKIRFVDKNNNGTLKADKIYLDIYGYAGPNDFAESGTYWEEYKLTHVVTLNGSENYSEIDTLYLNDGVYEVRFYTEGNSNRYDTEEIYLNVTANTKTLWIDLTSDIPPEEETHTLRVKFVDSETGLQIPLTDIFGDISQTFMPEFFLSNEDLGESTVTVQGICDTTANEVVFAVEEASPDYYLWLHQDFLYYNDSDEIQAGYVWNRENTDDLIHISGVVTKTFPLIRKSLIVGDVEVTPENASDVLRDGTVSFKYGTDTLTLCNANITADYVVQSNIGYLSIEIPEGTSSTLTIHPVDYRMNAAAIEIYGSCVIRGEGTLTIDGNMGVEAIYAENQLSILNVTLNLPSNNTTGLVATNKISLYGATINKTGTEDYGHLIVAKDISIGGDAKIDMVSNGSKLIWSTGGEIIITDSKIKLKSMRDDTYNYTIFAELGEIKISGKANILITTTKNDTSTDGELLVATNGIAISSDVFIICDEYGDPCEIYEANYGYSVRGVYGTYPTEIKIVPVNP